MIGAEQVVVNGFGNAHDAAFIVIFHHEFGDFIAGVHGIVAAVVEEIANVVFLKDLQDAAVIGIVHIRVSQLVAAGAQRGRRCVAQQLQLSGIFFIHDIQLIIQHAFDTVGGAVYLGNLLAFQRRLNGAQRAGIDDRRRSAGLADDTSSLEFFHYNTPLSKI